MEYPNLHAAATAIQYAAAVVVVAAAAFLLYVAYEELI